ncbi:MAG: hypothetical protein GY756_17685 [bacterium]|nr:hypothetical protein [bacterium]
MVYLLRGNKWDYVSIVKDKYHCEEIDSYLPISHSELFRTNREDPLVLLECKFYKAVYLLLEDAANKGIDIPDILMNSHKEQYIEKEIEYPFWG